VTNDEPTASLLWAFFQTEADLQNLLHQLSRFTDEQQQLAVQRWIQLRPSFEELASKSFESRGTLTELDEPAKHWASEMAKTLRPMFETLKNPHFARVPVDQLISVLTLIDQEYLDQLEKDLHEISPEGVARFAFPTQTPIHVRAVNDPTGRSITFSTSDKTAILGPLMVNAVPGVGLEIKSIIVSVPQFILVSRVAGRLYLRNGIHRAFALARRGLTEIPCLVTDEAQIPYVVGHYPAFAPNVLALPRPPLLSDMLDPALTISVPLLRTTKIFRFLAEELVLPIS
jgi:hypothetical protein